MSINGLEAVQLSKSYHVDSRQIVVLDNVSMTVQGGSFVVVEGKSGSGKSTLLSLLSGLDRPDAGTINLVGTDITDLSEDELAPFRNRTIGYVFQSFHLVPSLTAFENITFPAELNRDRQAAAKAKELLRRVDLTKRMNNFPHQLSGGEKQRIAICRALINSPQIIFADEPTGNLDSVNGEIIMQLLLELRRELKTTLVLATHSREISSKADSVVRLVDGRIENSSEKVNL
ncbi:MAG: ABC transporter ATP-binding protein [Proteobacteria bacterium]|nr:ABC transporter ATP-binding protein [Pseudomonadota bacterium]MBU1233915.1 ABC transporter ATP-binding protein [Pseudomonadota bacterium]MBU1417144.1 ABC transporter ATP-binding protein [Pseudomonadota bacterium]MBU1453363.1 ABC transporter ATP-binding protein [Pseudomonadota bacterium]